MSGPELRTLRERYGITLQQMADMLGLATHMQIYHWEKEYHKIPAKHQLRLAVLFLELRRRKPPTEPCKVCGGSGLVHREEDTATKDA